MDEKMNYALVPLIFLIPYLYRLLKLYRSLRGIKPYFVSNNPEYLSPVNIACKNEENNLPFLLKDISEQDYPPAYSR
jgi:hypothetical protein